MASAAVAVAVGRRVTDESSGSPARGQGTRRRPLVIGAIVIVAVLVAGGATAFAVSGSGDSGYRTTTVTRATIDQTQDVVGTVEPVSDATAAFQVAGQVATVTATVGEQVTAGESLATLDTTSLAESVSSAESTVASDEAQLTEDEDSETSASASAASATTTTTTAPASTGTSSTGGKAGSGSGASQITQDQGTLVGDQATSSADQQQEAADLSQAETTCGLTGSGSGAGAGGGGGVLPHWLFAERFVARRVPGFGEHDDDHDDHDHDANHDPLDRHARKRLCLRAGDGLGRSASRRHCAEHGGRVREHLGQGAD